MRPASESRGVGNAAVAAPRYDGGMRWRTLDGQPPRVIAHRGASGFMPEHTLEAYALAIEQGADVIEPDVVISRDGVLFARHDRGLARSTDVATRPEFAERARVDGDGRRDWYVDDFDAEEIERLRAVQPFEGRARQYDGVFGVPRLQSVLDLAAREGINRARPIAVYPELKHPGQFAERGLDPVATLVAMLAVRARREVGPPVWVQSFDCGCLGSVRAALGIPVYPLYDAEALDGVAWKALAAELKAQRFQGVALEKSRLLGDAEPHRAIDLLHREGLAAHVWTFRDDRVPPSWSDAVAELTAYLKLGVDAVFTDFPGTAVRARAALSA
jgi:glycerophosphoryl diester phosphodiesterase